MCYREHDRKYMSIKDWIVQDAGIKMVNNITFESNFFFAFDQTHCISKPVWLWDMTDII